MAVLAAEASDRQSKVVPVILKEDKREEQEGQEEVCEAGKEKEKSAEDGKCESEIHVREDNSIEYLDSSALPRKPQETSDGQTKQDVHQWRDKTKIAASDNSTPEYSFAISPLADRKQEDSSTTTYQSPHTIKSPGFEQSTVISPKFSKATPDEKHGENETVGLDPTMFSIEASEDQQRRESSHDVDETDFGVTVRHAEQKVWEEDELQLIREAERIAKAAEAFLDTAQDNLKRTRL